MRAIISQVLFGLGCSWNLWEVFSFRVFPHNMTTKGSGIIITLRTKRTFPFFFLWITRTSNGGWRLFCHYYSFPFFFIFPLFNVQNIYFSFFSLCFSITYSFQVSITAISLTLLWPYRECNLFIRRSYRDYAISSQYVLECTTYSGNDKKSPECWLELPTALEDQLSTSTYYLLPWNRILFTWPNQASKIVWSLPYSFGSNSQGKKIRVKNGATCVAPKVLYSIEKEGV